MQNTCAKGVVGLAGGSPAEVAKSFVFAFDDDDDATD